MNRSFPFDIARIAIQRSVGSAGHRKVRQVLSDELKKAGLLPYCEQGYILPYSSSGAHDLANIAAIMPGEDASLPPILIGAHYDACGETPGADDNAAAILITFRAVEIIRESRPDRSVICVFFDAEEPPFYLTSRMGSTNFFQSQLVHELRCAFILDLVGHDVPFSGLEDILFVTGMESHRALEAAINSTTIPAELRIVPTLNSYVGDMSDHHIFRVNGVPYLFLSCGRWEHYHMKTDTVEKLNFEKMAAVGGYLAGLITECDRRNFQSRSAAFDTLETELRMMNSALSSVLPVLGLGTLRNRLDIDAVANSLLGRLGL